MYNKNTQLERQLQSKIKIRQTCYNYYTNINSHQSCCLNIYLENKCILASIMKGSSYYVVSYIPSLRPHSAKSGKQSQRATSDSRNKYYINCLPPGSTPTLTQQSPAVCSENITATRVIFTTSGQVGLTAPVRLERRNTELKLEKEQIFELRARPTLIQNNCRNLSEVIGNFLVLARLAKVFID